MGKRLSELGAVPLPVTKTDLFYVHRPNEDPADFRATSGQLAGVLTDLDSAQTLQNKKLTAGCSVGENANPVPLVASALSFSDGTDVGQVISKLLYASGGLNYGSIGGGGNASLTVTVTGAVVGDVCILGQRAFQTGIIFTAYVSSADTVTVVAENHTAGSINPPALTFDVLVMSIT